MKSNFQSEFDRSEGKTCSLSSSLNHRFISKRQSGRRVHRSGTMKLGSKSNLKMLEVGDSLGEQNQMVGQLLGYPSESEKKKSIAHSWILNLNLNERQEFTRPPLHLKKLSNIQVLKVWGITVLIFSDY